MSNPFVGKDGKVYVTVEMDAKDLMPERKGGFGSHILDRLLIIGILCLVINYLGGWRMISDWINPPVVPGYVDKGGR